MQTYVMNSNLEYLMMRSPMAYKFVNRDQQIEDLVFCNMMNSFFIKQNIGNVEIVSLKDPVCADFYGSGKSTFAMRWSEKLKKKGDCAESLIRNIKNKLNLSCECLTDSVFDDELHLLLKSDNVLENMRNITSGLDLNTPEVQLSSFKAWFQDNCSKRDKMKLFVLTQQKERKIKQNCLSFFENFVNSLLKKLSVEFPTLQKSDDYIGFIVENQM